MYNVCRISNTVQNDALKGEYDFGIFASLRYIEHSYLVLAFKIQNVSLTSEVVRSIYTFVYTERDYWVIITHNKKIDASEHNADSINSYDT